VQDLFSVGNIGKAHFAVMGWQFQLVTICHRLIPLFIQPLFEFIPVFSRF